MGNSFELPNSLDLSEKVVCLAVYPTVLGDGNDLISLAHESENGDERISLVAWKNEKVLILVTALNYLSFFAVLCKVTSAFCRTYES